MVKCLRAGCVKAAGRDEFCSSVCAKKHYGTFVERESAWQRRKRRESNFDAPEFVANPSVNRPAHEGTHTRQQPRFTTGRS